MISKKTPEFEAKKSVGIWIRVSTESQAQSDSPETHEHRARAFAASKGWEVMEVYHLEAVSGKSVIDHPEAQRMLNDLKRGRISALIFSKLARLARNTRELLDFADIFKRLGADLVSLQESIDTSTPAGRLFYSMIASMAQWEREEIADRINAALATRVKMGKPLNRRMPYGYKCVGDQISPEPSEAPVRKLMYELFSENPRIKRVVRILNERGYRTREGTLWKASSVGRLLRDPSAKGKYRANYTSMKGNTWVFKPKENWVYIDVEPIVSEELWNICNKILSGNLPTRRGPSPVQLFAGRVYCHCGVKMYVRTGSPKYVCQTCRNKIPMVDLEAVFVEQLKSFFLSPDEINEQLELADSNIVEKERVLGVLHDEFAKVDGEIKRIYRLHMDDKLDSTGFSDFYKPLQTRKRQLNEEIPRLQAEIDLLKINHISTDLIVSEAADLYGRWPQLTHDEKIRIIESLADKIIIGVGEIDISLHHINSSEELTKRHRGL